jgi:ArsR family transcriptional regulator
MSNSRTIDIERYSGMYAALANPHRLALLLRLMDICGPEGSCSTDRGKCACVGDLSVGLGIAQSTVSHHLKELRHAGLITMTRSGRNVDCSVDRDALSELSALLGGVLLREPTAPASEQRSKQSE